MTVEEYAITLLEPFDRSALEMDLHGSLEDEQKLLARVCGQASVLFHGPRE